jgi:preprotein translocase subunit SecB
MSVSSQPTPKNPPQEASHEAPKPFFNIQRIYLKDLSLEQPHSPAIFLETSAPRLEVEIAVDAQQLEAGIFESVVTGTVTAKAEEKVVVMIEIQQAGIFDIRDVPDDQIDPLVRIMCPSILFPYLRANVADMMTRAGFPAVHLAEVNFQMLYEQHLAQSDGAKSDQEAA